MVKDYSNVQNNLCVMCDGRGFHWVKLPGGENMPTVYAHGDVCDSCNGTGIASDPVGRFMGCMIYTAIALAILAFVIIPVIRQLT